MNFCKIHYLIVFDKNAQNAIFCTTFLGEKINENCTSKLTCVAFRRQWPEASNGPRTLITHILPWSSFFIKYSKQGIPDVRFSNNNNILNITKKKILQRKNTSSSTSSSFSFKPWVAEHKITPISISSMTSPACFCMNYKKILGNEQRANSHDATS